MHSHRLCALRQFLYDHRPGGTERRREARRRELLLDAPHQDGVAAPTVCRDPRHRFVPLANPPAYATGPCSPPRVHQAPSAQDGRSLSVPTEIWERVCDALDDDVDDLLAMRSTCKFFAALVDLRAPQLFGPKVWRMQLNRKLTIVPAACARVLLAKIETMYWEVRDRREARELAVLLPQLVGMRALALVRCNKKGFTPPMLPPNLRELNIGGVYVDDADAWVAQLPRSLLHLGAYGGALVLRRPPDWPPALRALTLYGCEPAGAYGFDFSRLSALCELELTTVFARGAQLRLPQSGGDDLVGWAIAPTTTSWFDVPDAVETSARGWQLTLAGDRLVGRRAPLATPAPTEANPF